MQKSPHDPAFSSFGYITISGIAGFYVSSIFNFFFFNFYFFLFFLIFKVFINNYQYSNINQNMCQYTNKRGSGWGTRVHLWQIHVIFNFLSNLFL